MSKKIEIDSELPEPKSQSDLFNVVAIFHDLNGNPITGSDYSVKLYDDDPLFDDYLGSSHLDKEGKAHILIAVADIYSIDSPAERTPDLYFVLEKEDKKIFTTEIIKEVNFDGADSVTQRLDNTTQTFGPFTVTE